MNISHATHIGSRESNEDSYVVVPELDVVAVCDGLGGHAAGEVASSLAVRAIRSTFLTMSGKPLDGAMRAALLKANKDILRKGRTKAHRGMGTTVVALAFGTHDMAVVAWAGDSRCYRLRGGLLEQLTSDHSLVNHLVTTGQLSPEEAVTHPDRGMLHRCLGVTKNESGDIRLIDVRSDDTYLLCSDGLTDALTDEMIEVLLRDGGEAQALVDAVIAMGRARQDNVSVIVVRTP